MKVGLFDGEGDNDNDREEDMSLPLSDSKFHHKEAFSFIAD